MAMWAWQCTLTAATAAPAPTLPISHRHCSAALAPVHVVAAPVAAPPYASSLTGWFTAHGYNLPTSTWRDWSGAGNHVSASGQGIRQPVGHVVLHGAAAIAANTSVLNGQPFISGNTSARVFFPATLLPPRFTMFHVTRYFGSSAKRILAGSSRSTNWLSCHHEGRAGLAIHAPPHFGSTLTVSVTGDADLHGSSWVLSVDQHSLYRSQGVQRSSVSYLGYSGSIQIGINAYWVGTMHEESSDWAAAAVLIYDRELNAAEIEEVENHLSALYAVQLDRSTAGGEAQHIAHAVITCRRPTGLRTRPWRLIDLQSGLMHPIGVLQRSALHAASLHVGVLRQEGCSALPTLTCVQAHHHRPHHLLPHPRHHHRQLGCHLPAHHLPALLLQRRSQPPHKQANSQVPVQMPVCMRMGGPRGR